MDFYSRASCEARLCLDMMEFEGKEVISTHAPRVRRDLQGLEYDVIFLDISTHAPRVRRDPSSSALRVSRSNFYSRASCEARQSHHGWYYPVYHFYSRASCEARLSGWGKTVILPKFLLTRLV